jgi:hypothetical protein
LFSEEENFRKIFELNQNFDEARIRYNNKTRPIAPKRR